MYDKKQHTIVPLTSLVRHDGPGTREGPMSAVQPAARTLIGSECDAGRRTASEWV